MRFTGNILDDGGIHILAFGPFSSPSTCNWMDMESTTSQTWWNVMMIHTHTHLTSGCRLKRSVARRKTMGWPPNAIQPSETCRLVSAGWWDDKFLKWPCTFRRIGVQNHCFTSRWWAQLKQRAPKKLWTFQVHDRLPPVFLTFCFNLLSPWYSQHSSCFTTLHLPVIRPDHPWPASNRVTSTCSTEASSLGTLSRSFNLSRWEDSTWIRCHILILRPRFFFLNNGLHLTVNLLNLTYVNTIVNMFLDKIWRFSQVHGATPLARLLSGRQQLAGHASLCGLNVKSSVRCCSQPYQLSSSFRSLCCHGNLKCWAKFVVACPWCSARPVPAESWNNLHTKSGVCVRSVKVCLRLTVSPIGSEWTGLHTIRSSTHALSLAKKHQKPSTSLQAATRRPFKSLKLKNCSTFIFKKIRLQYTVNTAKLHALSSAVVYRCHLLNMLPCLLHPWCWEVQIHPGARAGYLVAAGTKELPPFFHNHGHTSISISFDHFQLIISSL